MSKRSIDTQLISLGNHFKAVLRMGLQKERENCMFQRIGETKIKAREGKCSRTLLVSCEEDNDYEDHIDDKDPLPCLRPHLLSLFLLVIIVTLSSFLFVCSSKKKFAMAFFLGGKDMFFRSIRNHVTLDVFI